MNQTTAPSHDADDNALIAERRAKLAAQRARGVAFPNDFKPADRTAPLIAAYGALENEAIEPLGVRVTIAGRLMLKRVMGKASFATIQDMSGQIQVYVTDSYPGKTEHEAFKHWDLGDIIGVDGILFKTKTGEVTVTACSITGRRAFWAASKIGSYRRWPHSGSSPAQGR